MSDKFGNHEIMEGETRVTACPCCGEPVTSITGIVLLSKSQIEAEFFVDASGGVMDVAIVMPQSAGRKGVGFLWKVTQEMPRPMYAHPRAWPQLTKYAHFLPKDKAKKHAFMPLAQEALCFLLQKHREVAQVYRFVVEQHGGAFH